MLDLLPFVVDKLPDDGTLVPKHVGVGTCYEVCFVTYFVVHFKNIETVFSPRSFIINRSLYV